jgi:hypothetical protein
MDEKTKTSISETKYISDTADPYAHIKEEEHDSNN